ncbi:MAG: lasso peptide biosynthesis B2 protein [Victivallaceae bacterium]|nr:lasso peptide biosynthesis B2 protein [Victivallaceae bacterium]
MFNYLKSFIKIPLNEKKIVFETVVLLLLGRILLLVPYKYMKRFFGVYNETPENKVADIRESRRISIYIRLVGNKLPWKCTCLVKALAAKIMLQRRKIPATIYFGMARNEERKLIAHAWVKCGDFLVVGKDDKYEYKTVGYFS